jgi:hypothetical protein
MIENTRKNFSNNGFDNSEIKGDKPSCSIVNYYMECLSFEDEKVYAPPASQESQKPMFSSGILRYKTVCQHILEKMSSISHRLVADYNKIDQILDYYERYKNIIRKNMPQNISNIDLEIYIDRHKLAAAVFCAFLKSSPFIFHFDKSDQPVNFVEEYANEEGGFLFGLQIIQDFIGSNYPMSTSDVEREIFKKIIKLPYITDDSTDDSYIHWFIKIVTNMKEYLDFDNSKFNEKFIFIISHIYFLLESYSYQYNRAEFYDKRN